MIQVYSFSFYRYTSKTVHSFQVTEGKATELNFTLEPVASGLASGVDAASTQSTTATTTPHTPTPAPSTAIAPGGNESGSPSPSAPPEAKPTPLQPHDFRHHNNADMELFLRRHSSEFPAIAHLSSIGQSVEGRELYVMVISDNPTVHEPGMLGKWDVTPRAGRQRASASQHRTSAFVCLPTPDAHVHALFHRALRVGLIDERGQKSRAAL